MPAEGWDGADGGGGGGGGGNIKDSSGAGPVPRSFWLRSQLSSHEWSALVSVANHNGKNHHHPQQPGPLRCMFWRNALNSLAMAGYDFSAEGDVAIRRCGKTILEADRNAAAR